MKFLFLQPDPTPFASRTSHEVRGLKSCFRVGQFNQLWSHLTRGAWIEIMNDLAAGAKNAGRTSHEVRGLKFKIIRTPRSLMQSRTSHEVRGLKSEKNRGKVRKEMVAPHTRCVD